MKSAARFPPWLLLLVALVCIGLDYRTISILRSENDGLKAALQAKDVELARWHTATGEGSGLRRDLRRLAVENQQLRRSPPPAAEAATPSLR